MVFRLAFLSFVMALAPLTPAERQELVVVLREQDRRADLRQPDFGRWLTYNHPEKEKRWDYRHMLYMQKRFDEVTAGEISYLALGVSGRHGKTAHMMSYAVYILEREPSASILYGTYNHLQAGKIGRSIQILGYGVGLPILGTKPSHSLWYVEGGGELQCVGVDSGSASLNPNYILIDDPIGKRADAESFAHREKVWDWLTTDILARVVPGVKVVFSMPRWHVDDPFGRLLDRQSAMWTVIDMPGRALENDQMGRAEGELLWPELRGEDFHKAQRDATLEYGYASFIQCRPSPREGGMFKWAWWQLIDEVPATGRMIRYWDLAGTDVKSRSHDPDYSVGALLCRMQDKRTAIVDIERFRKSVDSRNTRVLEVCREDIENYPNRGVAWWIETETGIQGEERTAKLVRDIQACGMSVHTEHPTGKKEFRAEPLAGAAEAGNVVLCPGEWRDPFRAEMADFPNGRHDDQSDATAGAFQKLAVRTATRVRTFRI